MATSVLVTGAAGFAGSHLVERLAGGGATVTAWSHRSGQQRPTGAPATWRAVDLLDRDAVARAIESDPPSVIYHCAGVAQSSAAGNRIGATFEVNVRGTANLLAAVERYAPGARVVVTSSALVYRHAADPLHEGSPIGPAGPYAVSKLAQDTLSLHAAERGLDVVVARPFNHIGPRQSPEFVASSVARQVALIERGQMSPELRVGNLSAQRDFTDVRDVVGAYVEMAEHAVRGERFNVCSGRAVAIHHLVHGLVARSRVPIEIVVDPARFHPVDVPVLVGSADRLRKLAGWAPRIPLDRTLDDLLDWWRAHAT
ncbi:MAG: NAD-dependent epimerase/dehydratase family protein [Vicinamibacteria bacterium]|nr:NAD-dependent epimerase/dehydratase family protein [Vicinamibacteria bacterium]